MLLLFTILPIGALATEMLVPVGQIVGLQIGDDQVVIAGFDGTIGGAGQQAGLRVGDRITHINGKGISCAQDVSEALAGAKGSVEVRLVRDGKNKSVQIKPVETNEGPKLGVYLKQGVTGVGTVTWYDPETGRFGALGHGVNTAKGQLVTMRGGSVYRASVLSVVKGRAGDPGQLLGSLQGKDPIGKICKNTQQGIFGTTEVGWEGAAFPIASNKKIKTGEAKIISNVHGNEVQEYSVEILKIYPTSRGGGRNMLIKVTDPALLELTGGIVQGMSGSPIIQNGKLVGAVTHVLVNDPTTGYGIFIENMRSSAG